MMAYIFFCRAILMFNVFNTSEASHELSTNDNSGSSRKSQEKHGEWSKELIQRLKTHFCQPGVIHRDTTLLHGLRAGTFQELGRVKDAEVCVLQCCESHRCELALLMDDLCFGITCYSQQHCKTVPALETNRKMVTVLLHKATRANFSTQMQGEDLSQSKAGKSTSKNPSKFVFFPVDSGDSKDLAFSVNLHKIATHYTDDERVKKVLIAKADEHVTSRHSGHGQKVQVGKNRSSLDQFFSRDEVSSVHHGKERFDKKRGSTRGHERNDMNSFDWSSKILKAAISSSSVAFLIVVLVLLAMSKKKSQS